MSSAASMVRFTAPSGVLTGQMQISNKSGTVYFSVEEYKRPKFEVLFDTIKGSYKLGEKVTLSGHAKAYAGNNVDGGRGKIQSSEKSEISIYI